MINFHLLSLFRTFFSTVSMDILHIHSLSFVVENMDLLYDPFPWAQYYIQIISVLLNCVTQIAVCLRVSL
jgi:hypothetical protein